VSEDPFDLQRFVDAQQKVYPRVLEELRAGRKTSHWMWFVFPQLEGLGHSAMAQRYAISGKDEAIAYLAHPVLGPRLRECTRLVNAVQGKTIREILGSPDDFKFRSCMTLFAQVTSENAEFRKGLELFYGGAGDEKTLGKLRG
jgi:uncharacterized protein (DUF1810 family)